MSAGSPTVDAKGTDMGKLLAGLEELHGEMVAHNKALSAFAEKHEAHPKPVPTSDEGAKAEEPPPTGRIQMANKQVKNCLCCVIQSKTALAAIDDVLG